jgi:hypothetical protein
MATDASDPAQQRRELEEIRRQFAEVGKRMDSALEPASPQDRERPRALTRPTAPPAKPPAPPRWQWVAAALIFVLGTGLGFALPRSGPSNPPPSPPSTVQSTGRTQALQIQTVASVPEVCLEAAHYGDEMIAKLTIKQRDRRLAKVYKAYKLASQACRKQASG